MEQFSIGREAELAECARFLEGLEAAPGALVLAGEAGIGKTTVWKQVLASAEARSYRVLSCRPTESETALSFAALGDLLGEVPDEVMASLPAPQRRGLQVALLQAEPGEAGFDHRAISAGFVSVLAGLSKQAAAVVAIDDLRWLDRPSARVLEFAVRRLHGLRVGLVATMRTPDEEVLPLGLAEALSPEALERVDLGPLPPEVLHRVVRERLGAVLPRPSLVQIQQASGGNPFFALEIARSYREAGVRLPVGSHPPLPPSLGAFVEARIGTLSPQAQGQLMVAAALANPTVETLAAAAEPGAGAGLREAELAGVIEIDGGRVRFVHPLLASAVYSSATPEARRALHARIAGLVGDIEEKARHLSRSTEGPDDAIAAVMDAGAERADARGAPGAAAELAECARSLTPPGRASDLARRTIAAAGYHVASGDHRRARVLLEEVVEQAAAGPLRAEALRILGDIRYHDDGFPEAERLWRQALGEAGDDPRLRSMLENSLALGRLMMADFRGAKPHALAGMEAAETLGERGILAESIAIVALVELGRGTSGEKIQQSLELEDLSHRGPVGFRPSLITASVLCWEESLEEAADLFARLHRQILDRGREAELPLLGLAMVWNECWRGNLRAATHLAHQSRETSLQLGDRVLIAASLAAMALVDSWLGRVDEARREAEEATEGFRRAGWIAFTVLSLSPLGLLDLSLDNPAGVDATFAPLVELAPRLCAREPLGAPFIPDEIEALVALGELERATALIDQLEAAGTTHNRAWALATAARCRGLVRAATGDLDGALDATSESLRQHARLPMPFELARSLVVRGQIQRRRREKLAARESLTQALEIFASRGAALWAKKARTELARLGLRLGSGLGLTKTEERVADLAASGLTNREVADRLFISPKTVEANLSRIYAKLGVRSRTELAARMGERADQGEPTGHDGPGEGNRGVMDLRLTESLRPTRGAVSPDESDGHTEVRGLPLG